MSTDRPDIFIDQKAVAAVDQKIRETQAYTRNTGLMTSWLNPMEGVTTGPLGKITTPTKVTPSVPHGTVGNADRAIKILPPKDDFIVVPMQAMKAFKKLLEHCFELEVKLTQEQSKMLLEMLQAMPTPKKMFDAKAIFALMDSLARKVEAPK